MAPSLPERQLLRLRNGLSHYTGLSRPPVGRSPRDLVWRCDTARLWRYHSGQRRISPPILIVHSLISKSYILDLLPGNSMVGFLIGQGFDVFMLDWERARPADAENTLDTYVDDYLPGALEAVCERAPSDEVTLVGYCLGGVMALLLTAGQAHPWVRNLVTLTTPCDFSEMGFMSNVLLEGRIDPDEVIDATGLVPAGVLDAGFQLLKPTDEIVQRVNVWQNLWDDRWLAGFTAINRWARDQLPFPGAALRQIVEVLIRGNELAGGVVTLADREVRLREVTCPVLNVLCSADELVPPRAAQPLGGLVGSDDVTELILESGHVGLVAGGAAKDAQPRIAEWIEARSDGGG